MLGIDWLTANNCQWLFDKRTLVVAGKHIPLKGRPSRVLIRRVYVQEDLLVPPDMETHVPVRVTWSSLRAPKADWLIEPKRLRAGVFVARTLLPGDKDSAVVRVVNASGYPYMVRAGDGLGNATPAVVQESDVRASVVDAADGVDDQRTGRTGSYRSVPVCTCRTGRCR